MILLITGAPGAGKSALMVQLLREFIADGRPIYVDNVPELTLPHEVLGEFRKWHEPGTVPDGAVIVGDEVQRHWRPAGSGAAVPPDIAALETHRHRGLDFVIVTQHENLIHANVRRLVGRHIHLKDLGVLGRRWYEWNECGTSERPKTAIVQKRYTLPKQSLGAYKSASIHVKPKRSIPPALILAGLAGFLAIGMGLYVVRSVGSKAQGDEAQATPAAPAGTASSPTGRSLARDLVQGPKHGGVSRLPSEPFDGLRLHLLGTVTHSGRVEGRYVATVDGRVVAQLHEAQLAKAGYTITHLAPCVAVVRYLEAPRHVICDAPTVAPAAPLAAPAGQPPAPDPVAPLAPLAAAIGL